MEKSLKNCNIVFMGTPDFAATILQALYNANANIIAVFAQPDRPQGRGHKLASPPVALLAKEKGQNLYQPDKINTPDNITLINNLNPDFIVAAAYGQILPESILNIPKYESLNVHASLLPKYRGAAPINYALLNGDEKTGVSIMRMVKKMDAGPVFLTRELPIAPEDTTLTLTQKLAQLGGHTLIKAIDEILTTNLSPEEQDETLASFSPKITKDMGKINWEKSAKEILCQIKAMIPWPIAFTTLNETPLKIFNAKITDANTNNKQGTLISIKKEGWLVATGKNQLLITEVQLQGKKRMSAFDLSNGLRLKDKQVIFI